MKPITHIFRVGLVRIDRMRDHKIVGLRRPLKIILYLNLQRNTPKKVSIKLLLRYLQGWGLSAHSMIGQI